jgi:ATP-dependent phosphofructokinase / diphosphate-dependent phosphofructokinase
LNAEPSRAPIVESGELDAYRDPDRRWGLPRAERGHPGRGPQGISSYQHTIFGFRNGYQGLVDQQAVPLTLDSVRGILHQGGTIPGTSRVDPLRHPDGAERVKEAMEIHLLDGLIVIGGEGTLATAWKLHSELEIPVVAVPKTIDNDLTSTDRTFGFDTAVTIATEAVDRLHSTAEAHQRVMVLEVMGRHAGWIATHAGIAGGADLILIPEKPFDIVQVARHLKRRAGIGRTFSIVVVAEGATPIDGTMQIPEHDRDDYGRPRLGGISQYIAAEIEQRTAAGAPRSPPWRSPGGCWPAVSTSQGGPDRHHHRRRPDRARSLHRMSLQHGR